ncbi:hypothetical protein PR202_ga26618 [Eleusine coracana subsp. coracana]|uniref:t-SNARE coiled-coil homology domain-containing protein n=1 Tax=Eleusine coracana subsp. coracana TaxID=191504 RepID=A0AAV5DCC6_ELECO|nr:hypothetical protein PR202_ga26618 [Eleusine coracana subsp. coracana]
MASPSTPNPATVIFASIAPPRAATPPAASRLQSPARKGAGAGAISPAITGGGRGEQRAFLLEHSLPSPRSHGLSRGWLHLVRLCIVGTNPFDSDSDSEVSSRPSRAQSVPVQRADQSVQELELYAGEQIMHSHQIAADIERDLSVAEKAKQDDALSDLSNMLGQLKGMALDMGTEIERQNKALDTFSDDVDELNFRVKGANQRGRRLLGK